MNIRYESEHNNSGRYTLADVKRGQLFKLSDGPNIYMRIEEAFSSAEAKNYSTQCINIRSGFMHSYNDSVKVILVDADCVVKSLKEFKEDS